MSVSGAELQKAPSAQNARLQLHRSTSEVPLNPKHHRLHHHPHLHRRDKEEKTEKSTLASPQPSATFEGIKSEGVTPNGSRAGSRRTSIVPSADQNPVLMERLPQPQRRVVKESELKAEKEKSALRAAELRKSLVDLNTLSNNTTSRLDNTYYSVLEKLSILHSTIASLKELAALTRKLNDDFIQESTEVVEEIESQLEGFEDFQGQERKVGDLKHRIEMGWQKAHLLCDRAEAVKLKIELWERVEGEWQQRTRKRLKYLWAVTVVALLILVGLVAFQYTPARTQGLGVFRGFNTSNITANIPELEDVFGNETQSLKRSAIDALEKLKRAPEEKLGDDPRLRAFDEL